MRIVFRWLESRPHCSQITDYADRLQALGMKNSLSFAALLTYSGPGADPVPRDLARRIYAQISNLGPYRLLSVGVCSFADGAGRPQAGVV
jgi:hypothetical protein